MEKRLSEICKKKLIETGNASEYMRVSDIVFLLDTVIKQQKQIKKLKDKKE